MTNVILEIVEGGQAGLQVPLAGPLELGRDPAAGVNLDDDQVSRRHARVSVQDAQVVIEDVGSTNGTYVNDQPIHGPRVLQPGDHVRVGLTVLEVRDPDQVARQPSAVRPMPQLTVVGQGVLQPATPAELPRADPQAPRATAPQFLAEESEPAFVPREALEDVEARADYAAIARLVDARVKRQTTVAVFALLGASALAVLIAFGLG